MVDLGSFLAESESFSQEIYNLVTGTTTFSREALATKINAFVKNNTGKVSNFSNSEEYWLSASMISLQNILKGFNDLVPFIKKRIISASPTFFKPSNTFSEAQKSFIVDRLKNLEAEFNKLSNILAMNAEFTEAPSFNSLARGN